jgi:hypothetical protein
VTIGSVEPMKKLYARWGNQVHFLDVVVRQAHPGPAVPAYESLTEKWRDAEAYQREEAIPWTILVDDLEGTVHQVYGGLADPTYLIGIDGRVAYYDLWTYAPALDEAIRRLRAQGGRGIVESGVNRLPYMLPALTNGWRGLRRGLPQSVLDLETASPGAAVGTWLGSRLRPVLAPLTLRARPLPPAVHVSLAASAAALAFLGVRRWLKRA